MRWVQHAAMRPHRCAAIPFIGNSNAKFGFFDFGTDLPHGFPQDQADHVYVSVEAVIEMAQRIGWVPQHQAQKLTERLAAEKQKSADLQGQIEALEVQLEAVAVLKNSGFRQQGAPGRPSKHQKVAG